MSNTAQITWPDKIRHLPRTLDRFRAASVFFDVEYPSFLIGNNDARKWTSWAAISATVSVPEVLDYDFSDVGLLNDWRGSTELRQIRQNKRFLVLKELRNYEMHLEYQPRLSHQQADPRRAKEAIDHDSFFFAPITWSKLQKLKNIRERRSPLNEGDVDAFNAYAQAYSVKTVVAQMLEWLAERAHSFSLQHQITKQI